MGPLADLLRLLLGWAIFGYLVWRAWGSLGPDARRVFEFLARFRLPSIRALRSGRGGRL